MYWHRAKQELRFSGRLQIKIINNSYEKSLADFNSQADVIMIWDVLEHIDDLSIFLSIVRKAMKNNGLLLVMVPNLKSLATRIIREKSPTFTWQHLNYFTIASLSKLLQKHHFSVRFKETLISEVGNIHNYLSFEDPYMGISENNPAFDFLTPDYIHRNLLGSRLLVVARKNMHKSK